MRRVCVNKPRKNLILLTDTYPPLFQTHAILNLQSNEESIRHYSNSERDSEMKEDYGDDYYEEDRYIVFWVFNYSEYKTS